MKLKHLGLALAALTATCAHAQTALRIYGLVDTGIVLERGGAAGNVSKLASGISLGSRIGFTGTEDLGGGLGALFTIESGFNADDGTLGQGGLLFGRQAFVGLKGGFGTLTFGRQYTPQYLTLGAVDPFGTGYSGTAANLMLLTGTGGRMNNAVKYVSPAFGGFTAEAAYGFGEIPGSTEAARNLGAAVTYAGGPLWARIGHHVRNNDTAAVSGTDHTRNTLLAASYDFDIVKAFFAYGFNKGPGSGAPRNAANPFGYATAPAGSTDSRDAMVGVWVPLGAGKIIASYVDKHDRTDAGQDARQWAVGYTHALSKRTELFTTYARIRNEDGAGYTVGGAIDPGSGDRAFNIGLRHNF